MTQNFTKIQNAESAATQINPIKVIIVDDSKLIRRAVREILESDPDITVIGEAENGAQALDLVPKLKPDVVTLDVNMPVMDGISTIKHLMIKSPLPAVMLSTLTDEAARVTFDALRYGATDFMLKPSKLGSGDYHSQQNEIVQRVKNAARVRTGSIRYVRIPLQTKNKKASMHPVCKFAVGIGVSEGGYGPLLNIIPALEPNNPAAYIIVFYTKGRYLDAFAHYLSAYSGVEILRAQDAMYLKGGTCYLLTGDEFVTLADPNDIFKLCVHPNPFPDRREAINILMFSLAKTFKQNAVGVILTGISNDGSEGLNEIKKQGGRTFVQDPSNCLHREMPISAIRSCSVENVISDIQIAAELNKSIPN